MFYCFIHNWYSTDAPCHICHPIQTITATTHTSTATEENKSNDSFQWTYESEKAFGQLIEEMPMDERVVDWRTFINGFKQSYTPKPQAENKPNRDWQIECFVGMGANYWRQRNGGYHSQPFQGDIELEHFLDHPEVYKIHSVKRLSDGEVFSVGDEVCWGRDKNFRTKIQEFKVTKKGNLKFRWSDTLWNDFIKETFELHKPQPQKLFTTEDGKDIFDGDEYWFWGNLSQAAFKSVRSKHIGVDTRYKKFSTKEAAEKYIAENKPQSQKEEQAKSCGVCGGKFVLIRGRYPNTDKRTVCPTCTYEKLEQLQEISSPYYGQASKNSKQ